MFLMYVDESGDCGLSCSPTRFFALTGLVVHELRWQSCLDQIIDFRQQMRQKFGLRLREELHAAHLINRPGTLVRIRRNDRLAIIRAFADQLATMTDLNIINVLVDKQGKAPTYNVFEMAWRVLIQRFENTLARRNFSGPQNPDDRGMLFPDHTDDKKLTVLLRKMRRYNPVPNQPPYATGYRNIVLTKIVEDPSFRRSDHSYFIQAVDLAAYLLYQSIEPSSYMRRKSGQNYFNRLDPIPCKIASAGHPLGIVRL